MQYELMKLRKGIPHFQIDCGYDEKHWENVDKENHIFYKTTFEIYRIHGNIEYWIFLKSKKKWNKKNRLIHEIQEWWMVLYLTGSKDTCIKHWESSWEQL